MTHLLIPTAALAVTMSASGTTYYVNEGCGNDAWAGTSPICSAPNGPKASIQAGIDATVDGDEVVVADGVYTGNNNKELDFEGKTIAVRSANGPDACIIDCEGFANAFRLTSGETAESLIEGFTITNGSAGVGGGMYLYGDTTVRNCVFTNNEADICGAVRHDGLGEMTFDNCTFSGNRALVAPGALGSFGSGRLNVIDCVFADNEADAAAAVATAHDLGEVIFVNCLFTRNIATARFGAIADGSEYLSMINCVLSRNEAGEGGGGEFGSLNALVVNTTVANNPGGGLACYTTVPEISNCVFWGNSPWQISANAVVTYSDVEGGWPGVGNIDLDPMFVQPGTDNVRLSIGSPCVNAGDNSAIPPGITTDIDGNPRIQGDVVDMGAYEGEFDAQAAADGESDFDNGEFVILIPNGDNLDPLETAAVLVVNTSGPDDATFVVTEYGGDVYPAAAGYSELSCILSLDTSLQNGQFFATLFIPFDATGLGRNDPAQVNLTCYDPDMGNWSLVVTANTTNSPGHDGPVGDRILALQGGDWGITNELGDYGVFWDPALQQGFAWAHVDAAEDFGLGIALCPADCLQTPDGEVSIIDFLALLRRWGESSVGSPCDIDADGVIGEQDVLDLLQVWGTCPLEPMPAVRPRSAHHAMFEALRASWGPCDGCEADRDGDGVVGVRDYLSMLAAWPSE
jgi:hypothetical protein